MNDMNRLANQLRRCIDDYGMVEAGDRIAVGVSGGKDSLILLSGMKHLQRFYPNSFELEAVTIDLGFPGMDYSGIAAYCNNLNVSYTVVPTDIREIVFDARKEENPCSLCSKMRRGALNDVLRQRGLNKLALGHHFDDAVETFFLSLLYEGQLSCFPPMTHFVRAEITQIRPMLYVGEKTIANLADRLELPILENTCPMDRSSKRYEVKQLVARLSREYPGLKSKVFGAMQRSALEGWAVRQHGAIPQRDDRETQPKGNEKGA